MGGSRLWSAILAALALCALLSVAAPGHAVLRVVLGGSLVAAIAYSLWSLSPTRMLFGVRHPTVDGALAIAAILAFSIDAIRTLDIPFDLFALRVLLPIGVASLIAIGWWFPHRTPAEGGGAIRELLRRRGAGTLSRVTSIVLLLLFSAALVHPLLLLSRALAAAPVLCAAIAVLAAAIAWRGIPARYVIPPIDGPVRVLLALICFLLLRFAIETVPSALATIIRLPWAIAPAMSSSAALGMLGIVVIAAIPLLVWRSIALLRATNDHRHLPSWHPLAIGLAIGLSVIALLAPIAEPGTAIDGSGITLRWDLTIPAYALITGAICTVLTVLGAHADDQMRRWLMAVSMLIGTALALGFAAFAFVSEFLSSGAAILLAAQQGWFLTIVAQGLLLVAIGLAIGLGACGLVYEIGKK